MFQVIGTDDELHHFWMCFPRKIKYFYGSYMVRIRFSYRNQVLRCIVIWTKILLENHSVRMKFVLKKMKNCSFGNSLIDWLTSRESWGHMLTDATTSGVFSSLIRLLICLHLLWGGWMVPSFLIPFLDWAVWWGYRLCHTLAASTKIAPTLT